MAEKPILFSAPMVSAILAGRKTQTRRPLKLQPLDVIPMKGEFETADGGPTAWVGLMQREPEPKGTVFRCRYGVRGDRLWVRETWGVWMDSEVADHIHEPTWYRADYSQEQEREQAMCRWRPSIHMPRVRSRIDLEVVAIRVERLQEISAQDAIAEGLDALTKDGVTVKHGIADLDGLPGTDDHGWAWKDWERDPRDAYRKLWESINGKGSWDSNPWVWVVTFTRVRT